MMDGVLFEQFFLKKLRNLPAEKQQEALDFVEFSRAEEREFYTASQSEGTLE